MIRRVQPDDILFGFGVPDDWRGKPKTYLHVAYDSPVIMRDFDQLVGRHFVQGGTMVGRVLFAEPQPMVYVEGSAQSTNPFLPLYGHVLIKDCVFQGMI